MGRVAVSSFGLSASRPADGPQITELPSVADPSQAPPWLAAAEAVHASAPSIRVFVLDALLVAVAAVVVGASASAAAVGAVAFVVAGRLGTLYRPRRTIEAQGLSWYLGVLPFPLLATAVALSADGSGTPARLTATVAIAAALLVLARAGSWLAVARARRAGMGLHGALLVGSAEKTGQLARRLEAYPETGLRAAATLAPANMNGQRSRARALLQREAVTTVLVAAEAHDEALVDECIRWSDGRRVEFGLVLPVGVAANRVARIGDLGVVPLGRTEVSGQQAWVKRVLDIAVSASLLLALAPVLLIVSAAIYLYDRGPVVYRQKRVGRDNREFTIWKFRSMVPGADKLTQHYAESNMATGLLFKVAADPRVTPVGNVIRRLSIDELPQLVNVLVGDMSLVGPRPLPVDPEEFDIRAARRHRVRPGITGPWQVAGGHVLGYEDMIRLDLAYVDTWSLRRDLWLLLMTIPAVMVRRSSAY
ncbi:MAG: exopolysaccharide biosynthesis polyprenyl glycosylphosphotransferase [Acidimicrobiales bacterium]|nr:exopolysaccharide biosynthesis polyprenyl glycosylphosphotransferase [Acidimicrobiales bacterium]